MEHRRRGQSVDNPVSAVPLIKRLRVSFVSPGCLTMSPCPKWNGAMFDPAAATAIRMPSPPRTKRQRQLGPGLIGAMFDSTVATAIRMPNLDRAP
jgi:hypothetical protein